MTEQTRTPSPISYAQLSDATAKKEADALASVYRLVLAKKKVAGPRQAGNLEDARERIKDARTRHHCT